MCLFRNGFNQLYFELAKAVWHVRDSSLYGTSCTTYFIKVVGRFSSSVRKTISEQNMKKVSSSSIHPNVTHALPLHWPVFCVSVRSGKIRTFKVSITCAFADERNWEGCPSLGVQTTCVCLENLEEVQKIGEHGKSGKISVALETWYLLVHFELCSQGWHFKVFFGNSLHTSEHVAL